VKPGPPGDNQSVAGAPASNAVGRRLRAGARLTARAAWAALVSFSRSDNLTYAASIAYYALLSLFPFSLLAVTLLGRFAASDSARESVLRFVLQYFPGQFGFITEQLDAFQTTSITLGLVGTIALVWGAQGVFSAITTAVNYAWRVEESRSYVKHKLVAFLMLLVAGAMLVVALALASASKLAGANAFAAVLLEFPRLLVLRGLTVRVATTVLFMLNVGLIYYFVPHARVRFRDVWLGALVTGLLWRGAVEALSWYMRDMTRLTRVNGSIAAVVVFLIWVYVQAVILLYGVEFTAACARLREGQARDGALPPRRS